MTRLDSPSARTAPPRADVADDALFVRRVLIVAAVAIFFAVVWLLSEVILLVFGAILVSTTLLAMARPLQRLGIGETLAVVVVTLMTIALLAASIAFYGAEIAAQARSLPERFAAAAGSLASTWQIGSIGDMIKNANPASGIARLVPGFVSWGMSLGGAVLGFLLVIVGGFYLSLNPAAYRDGALKLVPPSYRPNIAATADDIGEALRRWVRGQLTAMVMVGVMTTAGLWVAGVQSPLALGLLAGLANFVPYVGSIAAAVVTLVIAASQSFEIMLWAAAVMLIVQQIESNVITPIVVGGAVSIAPATGMFAILAMAVLFGPLGVLFGFPLAIVADMAIRRLYVRDTLKEPVEILGEQA